MDFVPQDVARWRREMIDWTKREGPEWYSAMISLGQQRIKPQCHPALAGQFLANAEVKRLRDAQLCFFDPETCDILSGAFGSMPPFAPIATDLPSPSGFVMFAKPIMDRDPVEGSAARKIFDTMEISHKPECSSLINEVTKRVELGQDLDQIVHDLAAELYPDEPDAAAVIAKVVNLPMRKSNERLIKERVQIVGASWSPAEVADNDRYRCGGVWISFYSKSNLDVIEDSALLHKCRQFMPLITVDNEAIVPWCPDDAERDDYLLGSDHVTDRWARMLFAAFRIGRQRSMCTETVERCQRAERRRGEQVGVPPRDITVVRLRARHRQQGEHAAGTGTKHSYRYPVSTHWRQQWYPSLQDNRPILILQHIRGPEGAEIRHTDRVTVL